MRKGARGRNQALHECPGATSTVALEDECRAGTVGSPVELGKAIVNQSGVGRANDGIAVRHSHCKSEATSRIGGFGEGGVHGELGPDVPCRDLRHFQHLNPGFGDTGSALPPAFDGDVVGCEGGGYSSRTQGNGDERKNFGGVAA